MWNAEVHQIESELIYLALEGNPAARQAFADIYLLRRDWERTESAEAHRELVTLAETARAWLDTIED